MLYNASRTIPLALYQQQPVYNLAVSWLCVVQHWFAQTGVGT